jgi:NDP-sugar pyrophosphorylase family protein
MKERVTLTLEKDILKMVDDRVDGTKIKNRSHAIELFIRHALQGQMPSTAVILAGGRKSKAGNPKALAEVNGKPLIVYNIELCQRHGVKNIIICTSSSEQIMECCGDGKRFGVSITYIQENEPLGTAGPLKLLRDKLTSTFILLNGDELKDINLNRMFHMHLENDSKATIALTTVDDPSQYGVAMLDGNKIMRFVEKPKPEDAPSRLINAGLYILEPEILRLVPEGFSMIEQDVFPKLAREGELYGYPFSGQWVDTRDSERMQRAAKEWRGFSK